MSEAQGQGGRRRYDPNDPKWNEKGGNKRRMTPGKGKILVPVGFGRSVVQRSGNRRLSIHMACLLDPKGIDSKPDDKHRVAEVFEDFILEDSSMWRFNKFVQAIGYGEPYDPDDDEDVRKIVAHGFVKAEAYEDTYNGETRIKVRNFEPANVNQDDHPEWDAVIEASEEGDRKLREFLAKKAADAGQQPDRSAAPPDDPQQGGAREPGDEESEDSRIPF